MPLMNKSTCIKDTYTCISIAACSTIPFHSITYVNCLCPGFRWERKPHVTAVYWAVVCWELRASIVIGVCTIKQWEQEDPKPGPKCLLDLYRSCILDLFVVHHSIQPMFVWSTDSLTHLIDFDIDSCHFKRCQSQNPHTIFNWFQ